MIWSLFLESNAYEKSGGRGALSSGKFTLGAGWRGGSSRGALTVSISSSDVGGGLRATRLPAALLLEVAAAALVDRVAIELGDRFTGAMAERIDEG